MPYRKKKEICIEYEATKTYCRYAYVYIYSYILESKLHDE